MALIAVSFVCGALPASAGDDFGQSWPKIIQGLNDRGIKKIGDFDVADFVMKAKAIRWETMPESAPSVISGSRKSAYYLRAEHKVVISKRLPGDALASLPALELHEALGAVGYDDRNYALSTALHLLSKMDQPERREKLRKKYGAGL